MNYKVWRAVRQILAQTAQRAAYEEQLKKQREAALDELAKQSQELGLY